MKKSFMIPIIFVAISSCTQKQYEESGVEDIKNAFVLTKQQVSKTMHLPAELLAYERAELTAKIDGYVKTLRVDIGAQVRKGELLVVLEAPEVAAHYAEANARYQEAEANYNRSSDRYDRIQNAARKQGVIAVADVINTRNQMLADSAAMVSARSTALAYGELQEYLSIRAPFDGVITSRLVDPGDFVGTQGNKILLVIERPDLLRLRVYVPETYVNSLPAGENITFATGSVHDKTFTAKLARKSGSIDRDTRTELWEYEYPNAGGELKPGMYAMASLQLNRPTESFVVPYPAVVTTLEKKFVVRVRDGTAEWVDIREGISADNSVEIFGSLNEGDTILFMGSDEIRAGAEINITVQDSLVFN